jgi:hypothetical protein
MKKSLGMTAPDGRGSIKSLITGAYDMEPRPSEAVNAVSEDLSKNRQRLEIAASEAEAVFPPAFAPTCCWPSDH